MVRLYLIMSFAFLVSCQLVDTSVSGEFKGNESLPSTTPASPSFSLGNTTVEMAQTSVVKNTPTTLTITTKDQYGDVFYENGKTVSVSISNGTTNGWFTDVVDNGDGTYTTQFFSEELGAAGDINVQIDSQTVTHSLPSVDVVKRRLKYTGLSKYSADPSLRVFDESASPAWTLTGECDVALGDVTIEGPDLSPSSLTTPCLSAGGGTFSQDFNYSTTQPYMGISQGTIHFYVKQSTEQPIHTWVYKTHSVNTNLTYINDLTGLQAMVTNDATVFYILTRDISANTIGADNWTPVGSSNISPFIGQLDGNGFTIFNLSNASANYSGLFGVIRDASITNLNLENIYFSGIVYAGGIVGSEDNGTVNSTTRHVSVQGEIQGNSGGGVVGIYRGSIYYSSFVGRAQGLNNVGGIIGKSYSWSANYLKSKGTVTGTLNYIGGIIGDSFGAASIRYSASDATVSSPTNNAVGGLAGDLSTVLDSYFTGSASAVDSVGGISNFSGLFRTYSSGDVTATTPTTAGPLVGNFASINDTNYYLSSATCAGCTNSSGIGKTFMELQQRQTFTSWDFMNVWKIDEGNSTPTLRWLEHELVCPPGYVLVPPLDGYTTKQFCVMKYEAKLLYDGDGDGDFSNAVIELDGNSDNNATHDYDAQYANKIRFKAVSNPIGQPWTYIKRGENGSASGKGAIEACQDLGPEYDLITNDEWQTIARNIELVPSNWDEGVVGGISTGNGGTDNNQVNHGHADNDPAQSCDALEEYVDGNCSNSGNESAFEERRTHSLSTGEKIWDIAGNAHEWVKDGNNNLYGGNNYFSQITSAAPYDNLYSLIGGTTTTPRNAKDQFGPLGNYTSLSIGNQGGLGLGIIDTSTGGAIFRGGYFNEIANSGVFYTYIQTPPTLAVSIMGFRCVYHPVSP